jgi:hypothetical protein
LLAPLCCHLLIGQPASGKTILARSLAPLVCRPGQPPTLVLSTDAIRAEVFGDAAVQGPWPRPRGQGPVTAIHSPWRTTQDKGPMEADGDAP